MMLSIFIANSDSMAIIAKEMPPQRVKQYKKVVKSRNIIILLNCQKAFRLFLSLNAANEIDMMAAIKSVVSILN
ncbi:hypothetical protein AwDysgo_14250 [Bacteroidales bacterium]|nr:hypothetical protein AwDysgo_14250 [Bacteroidales bacterium]